MACTARTTEHRGGAAFDVAVGQTLEMAVGGMAITVTVERKAGQRARLRVCAPRDAVKLALLAETLHETPKLP